MKILLCVLCVLCGQSAFAAQGDLIGFGIETNGWVARLTFEKLNTNGAFYNGFLTNNQPTSSNMLTITLRSMGFDSSGNGTTVQRTILGTKALRRPYPESSGNNLTNDFQALGSDVVIRVALSDWVYSLDSNFVVNVLPGAFAVTNGTGTNCLAASAISWATNNSTIPYPPPVCNWSWPGFQILPSNFTARVVGDAAYGIACVRFIARDTNGYAYTNFQTTRQIDYSMHDKVPVLEYIAPMRLVDSASGNAFSNGSPVRLDFTVYPKVGNITLSTLDGLFSGPPFYAPQTNICDRAGIYGAVTAVVATNGNNSTGVAATNFNASAPPLPFLDIGAAMNAIRLTNNVLFSRLNASGGTVLLSNGPFALFGTTPTIGQMNPGWLTIAPYPGTSCSITGATSGNYFTTNHRLHVTNVFLNSADTFQWYAEPDIWFDSCPFNESSTAYFQGPTNLYFTQCQVTNLKNGFYGQSTKVVVPVLVRGNDLTGLSGGADVQGVPYTVIGNGQDRPGVGGNGFRWVTSTGGLQPNPDGIVFCFNRMMCFSNDSNNPLLTDSFTQARGACIEQNIFECISSNQFAVNVYFCNNTNCTNVLFRNNLVAGQRSLIFADWISGVPTYHTFRSVCLANGNYWTGHGIKADNEPTQNSTRIGNWPCLYGVGWSQNIFAQELPSTGGTGSFDMEFAGLNSFDPYAGLDSNGERATSAQASNYVHFVNMAFCAVNFNGAGMGNYRWQSSSPVVLPAFKGTPWLEYDLEGNARGLFDPPGAYVSGNPKKGGFF